MAERNATLLFLIKRENGKIAEILLAMKKRGFGAGRWNGVGGKQEKDESIEASAIREASEEIGVMARDLRKTAELKFVFPKKPDWDQIVHVYLSENWQGDPIESEEMNPSWFDIEDIPYDTMWPDDIYWLPEVIKGKKVRAEFSFGEGDKILSKNVKIVSNL